MTALLRKWARSLTRRSPLPPLQFPKTGFDIIPPEEIVEEENFAETFKAGYYYPVTIGQVFDSKYQVLGKLGYGITSTVWLAQNLQEHTHVALKLYTRDRDHSEEFNIYNIINKAKRRHQGYDHVRKALDQFSVPRPGGDDHQCLVLKPAWESWKGLMSDRNPEEPFTPELLKAGLRHVFMGLDYLHTECKVIHTDIKSDNILIDLVDEKVIEQLIQAELEEPTPRKFVGDDKMPVFLSQRFELPRAYGDSVLSDFGHAARGDEKNAYDCQPDVYRSPEVMLEMEWSYPIDIWNVGVMIWDIFQGKHMFHGYDPITSKYMTRAHLAEVVGMLGPPPLDLLQRGKRSREFFDEKGNWIVDEVKIPENTSIGASDERFEGEEKERFVEFMRAMLQWRPEDRLTAKQLSQHPWLQS